MGASAIIPGVLGAVGLYQQKKASDKASSLAKKGLKSQQAWDSISIGALEDALKMLNSGEYDAGTNRALTSLQEMDARDRSTALTNFNTNWALQGGTPGSSSEWHTRQTKLLDSAGNRAAQFKAEREAGKLGVFLQTLLGVAGRGGQPGQLSNAYFNQANAQKTDPTAALQLLQMAMPRPGGAGGTGDVRPQPSPLTPSNFDWVKYL